MKIELDKINGFVTTEIISDEIIITELQDALNILAETGYLGSDKIIIHEKNFLPDFFDLSTGLAGEILQKFSNYHTRLAIVGNFSKYGSKSLNDFIFESNKQGQICFVDTVEEAKKQITC